MHRRVAKHGDFLPKFYRDTTSVPKRVPGRLRQVAEVDCNPLHWISGEPLASALGALLRQSLLIAVGVKRYTTITASDNSGITPTVTLVSVTSNEPDDAPGDADGKTKNDIVIVDQDTFRLRAERSDTGSGRIYTITYQTTDACGNRPRHQPPSRFLSGPRAEHPATPSRRRKKTELLAVALRDDHGNQPPVLVVEDVAPAGPMHT